jgi:thioredoxin 1
MEVEPMIQSIAGEDNFQKDVLQAKLPVLVDFWAQWCAPCLAAAPVLEELAKEYDGKISFAKVNVEDNGPLAAKYGVAAIPTMLIFKHGQPVQQIVGYKPKKELKKTLNELLET